MSGENSGVNIAEWDERYRSGVVGQETHATALLVQTVDQLPPGSALDLACGTGRHAIYLAERGWNVTAMDGSAAAIAVVRARAAERGLAVQAEVVDLQAPNFTLLPDSFDLVLIAYYLQRDLFAQVREAVKPGGLLVTIAHTPDPGLPPSERRAAPGELQSFFADWKILGSYEGPSRDPAHKRAVAELVARRPDVRN